MASVKVLLVDHDALVRASRAGSSRPAGITAPVATLRHV
jgi:hypothetical protein